MIKNPVKHIYYLTKINNIKHLDSPLQRGCAEQCACCVGSNVADGCKVATEMLHKFYALFLEKKHYWNK